MKSIFNFLRKTPAANRQDPTKTVDTELEKKFEVMEKVIVLKDLVAQLRSAIAVFEKFNCNQQASLMALSRLKHVISTFSAPNIGLVARSTSKSVTFPILKIKELEETLSNFSRYFSRFTQQDSLTFLLVGRDPEERFTKFDQMITAITNDIIVSMGIDEHFPSASSYKVVCNILPDIRELAKQHLTWDDYLIKQAKVRGVEVTDDFVQEQMKEVEKVNMFKHAYEDESFSLIQHDIYCILKQVSFRHFWSEKIHPKCTVSLNSLCAALDEYLVSLGASTEIITRVTTAFKTGLLSEDQINGGIDAYSIARLTRSIPQASPDFIINSLIVADNLSRGQILLMPCLASAGQVFYDDDQRELILSALLHDKNLDGTSRVSITGPKLAGKTHRVLHILHSNVSINTLPNNSSQSLSEKDRKGITSKSIIKTSPVDRDVVWVDLARLDRQTDGIARVSSQLFLRKCNSMEGLVSALNNLLSSLRPASLFVLDNVSFTSLQESLLEKITPTKKTNSTSEITSLLKTISDKTVLPELDDNMGSDWLTFLTKIVSTVRAITHVRLVIIGENLTALQTVAEFTNEIMLGPLSSDKAAAMITECTNSLQYRALVPLDIEAVKVASGCFPGEISALVSAGCLAGVRKVAKVVTDILEHMGSDTSSVTVHHAKSIAATETFNQLSHDEQLLSCCLLSNIVHFDDAMMWTLSKKAFHNDILRWDLARKGLLTSGWLRFVPDLGYEVSHIASYVKPICSAIDGPLLHDWYVTHWTDEAVRLNFNASVNPAGMSAISEYYTINHPHFRHIYQCVLSAKPRLHPSLPRTVPECVQSPVVGEKQRPLFLQRISSAFKMTTPRRFSGADQQSQAPPVPNSHLQRNTSSFSSLFSPKRLDSGNSEVDSIAQATFSPQPSVGNSNESIIASSVTSPGRSYNTSRTVSSQEQPQKVYVFPDSYTLEVRELTPDLLQSRAILGLSSLTLEAIVYKMAGRNGPVLEYHFSPESAIRLSAAFKKQLSIYDGEAYENANIELAEQLLRIGSTIDAYESIHPVINSIGYDSNKDPVLSETQSLPPHTSRALIAYGRTLALDKRYEEAVKAFDAAQTEKVLASISPTISQLLVKQAAKFKEDASSKVASEGAKPQGTVQSLQLQQKQEATPGSPAKTSARLSFTLSPRAPLFTPKKQDIARREDPKLKS